MNINSYSIRLSGRAEIPEDLDEAKNYKMIIEGSIPKTEFHDNQDGTHDKILTLKAIKVEVVDDIGKSIKAKDTRGKSQLFRARLWKEWSKLDDTKLDFNDWYDAMMINLIQVVDELVEMYRPNK